MNDPTASIGIALRNSLREARAIRFLCTGNMVRSAFAELYARHSGCPLPVDSAATIYQNTGLFPETRAALNARGVEAAALDAFQPRHLSRITETPDARLVVFGMTTDHLEAWLQRFPQHESHFLLSELLGSGADIADPVLDGADFQLTFRTVARAVEALVAALG